MATIVGTDGNDNLIGVEGEDNTIRGKAGDDTLIGADQTDRLYGNRGDDLLRGWAGTNRLDGFDLLVGGPGQDVLVGAGEDLLRPGGNNGRDQMHTVDGHVTVDFNQSTSGGFLFTDGLDGIPDVNDDALLLDTARVEVSLSRDGGDYRKFAAGGDRLGRVELINLSTLEPAGSPETEEVQTSWLDFTGDDGDDVFTFDVAEGVATWSRGGPGDDTHTGTSGYNGIYFQGGPNDEGVTVNVDASSGGSMRGTVDDAFGGTDDFTGIEQIQGTRFADIFDGSGGDDRFITRGGGDLVRGRNGSDTVSYSREYFDSVQVDLEANTADSTGIYGDSQDTLRSIENILGTAGADVILGSDANNMLYGQSGGDRISGRGGADELEGGSGRDFLTGNKGRDRLEGGDGADDLDGGLGRDVLFGNNGEDDLRGSAGNDRLFGGQRVDTLRGQNGNDELKGGAGADFLGGGSGADTLRGGKQADTLRGGSGADDLDGGRGRDVLAGNGGEDGLFGGGGNDQLFGGRRDDALRGQNGDDELNGGFGADRFIFDGADGSDVIGDFDLDVDLVEIVSGATGFADLTITDLGDDARVAFGNTEIVMQNIDHQALSNEHFLFT